MEIDDSLRVLRSGNVTIQFTPKSFDLLSYLFQRRTRVVPKIELLTQLWPSGSNEHSLHQEIHSIRRGLALHGLDDCIVTVSRKGYRFQIGSANEPHRGRLRHAVSERTCDSAGWSAAQSCYESMCEFVPGPPAAHFGAVRAVLHLAVRSATSPERASSIAHRHLAQLARVDEVATAARTYEIVATGLLNNRVARALRALETCRPACCTAGELEHWRAFLYLSQKKTTEAIAAMKQAVEIAPHDIQMHLHHAFMCLMGGDLEVAEGQLQFIRRVQPENCDAIEHLALARLAQRTAKEAGELVSSIFTPRAVAIRCVAAAALGKEAKAREALRWLVEGRVVGFVSALLVARCYMALKNDREAKSHYARGSFETAARWFDLENRLWLPGAGAAQRNRASRTTGAR